MSPWLTLVIGVILGLLIGWLIDLLYRRRDTEANLDAVDARTAPSGWSGPAHLAPTGPVVTTVQVDNVGERQRDLDTPEQLTEPAMPATSTEPADSLTTLDRAEDWPAVSAQLSEVAGDVDAAPSATPRIIDEAPTHLDGLPPAAVEALSANVAETRAPEPVQSRDRLILIEGIGPVYEKKLNAAGITSFSQLIQAGEDRLREVIQPQSWQRVNFAEWIEQARLLLEGKDEELKTLQTRLFSRKKA